MAILYCSTDIEADGPIPGQNSMLSFATAVYDIEKKLISTFSRNLELLPEAKADPETTKFWNRFPDAYAATREDVVEPRRAMRDFADYLDGLDGRPVMVAYPGGFDFMWTHWYLIKFAGRDPMGHSVLCLKSYASAVLAQDFHKVGKRSMPRRWFDKSPHTHVALDDAIEQGALGINMIREQCGLSPI